MEKMTNMGNLGGSKICFREIVQKFQILQNFTKNLRNFKGFRYFLKIFRNFMYFPIFLEFDFFQSKIEKKFSKNLKDPRFFFVLKRWVVCRRRQILFFGSFHAQTGVLPHIQRKYSQKRHVECISYIFLMHEHPILIFSAKMAKKWAAVNFLAVECGNTGHVGTIMGGGGFSIFFLFFFCYQKKVPFKAISVLNQGHSTTRISKSI